MKCRYRKTCKGTYVEGGCGYGHDPVSEFAVCREWLTRRLKGLRRAQMSKDGFDKEAVGKVRAYSKILMEVE